RGLRLRRRHTAAMDSHHLGAQRPARMGCRRRALAGTAEKLADVRWEYENLPYWGGEVDVCINSWALSNGLWLDADVDGLVDWLLEHQQDDGGLELRMDRRLEGLLLPLHAQRPPRAARLSDPHRRRCAGRDGPMRGRGIPPRSGPLPSAKQRRALR